MNDIYWEKDITPKFDTIWFKCDKAWFGAGVDYHKIVYDFILRTKYDNEFISKPLSLLMLMSFAENRGMPYKISSVDPYDTKAVDKVTFGQKASRINAINKYDSELRKYDGCVKPIDNTCYQLLRNIARYLIEQDER